MGKEKKEQGLESFLKSDFLDQLHSTDETGYEVIDSYPIKAPFSYVNILKDKETSSLHYQIDEVKLNQTEQKIYDQLYNLMEQNLGTIDTITKDFSFEGFVKDIIKNNEKVFAEHPLASIEKVRYYLDRDVAGYGIIDPLMNDHNIEDISCSGIQMPIYIWHRKYDSIPCNIQFEDEKLNSFVSKIVFKAGKHVSSAHPITDLALKGGHRISVLYQKEVTPKGTSFTIRKFKEDPYSIVDLISFGTISPEIAAYLWMLMEAKMSIIVIGSTGSGKTTLLNAATGLINPDFKIFSVEDVAEINIKHENWFSLVSRTGFGVNGEGEIGLYELIKSGVRHRPDYIVVGEIRGSEAYVMFQAMATGHGGLCTMHADSVNSASKRLQQKPMDIPPAYISLMHCALIVRRVQDEDGNSVRRTIDVQEIKTADNVNNVFKWKPDEDFFEAKISDSILLKRIADNTGKTFEDVVAEYENRITVLRWLAENGIRDYEKVGSYIGRYYKNKEYLMNKIQFGGF